MRIAVIHSFYRSAVSSGENVMVTAQAKALEDAGHQVALIAQYSDTNRSRNPLYPLKAGFDVASGNGYDPTKELLEFGPDVVWVHNLFPNFSTKWLDNWQGPLVATLYNFRPVCVNGVLFREGKVCTLCPDGHVLSGIKYGCYKNSRLASIPLTIRNAKGLRSNPLLSRAERTVVLSKSSLQAYSRFGLDSSRMVVIPTYLSDSFRVPAARPSIDRWTLASRLSPEKGALELVRDWPDDYRLDIYGDGEERAHITAMSQPRVAVHGVIDHDKFVQILPRYTGMIFPSLCFETQGLVVVEAFEAGVPVVARAGSAGADLVEEFQAGAVYGPGHISLREALDYVSSNQEVLRKRARAAYEQNFTKEIWLKRIEKLYESVIAEHKKSSG